MMTNISDAPIDAILNEAGERGAESYAPYALRHPNQLRFAAVAEPDSERLSRFAARHHIPSENQFPSWEPLLARPKLGQAALVCTQDQNHTAPALAALRAGYDVLLEKPMATSNEECRQLFTTAENLGRQLHVCHILRDTTGEIATGHGGGYEGLMTAFSHSLHSGGQEARGTSELASLTPSDATTRQALTSPLLAFAEEEARLGKTVVEIEQCKEIH